MFVKVYETYVNLNQVREFTFIEGFEDGVKEGATDYVIRFLMNYSEDGIVDMFFDSEAARKEWFDKMMTAFKSGEQVFEG